MWNFAERMHFLSIYKGQRGSHLSCSAFAICRLSISEVPTVDKEADSLSDCEFKDKDSNLLLGR